MATLPPGRLTRQQIRDLGLRQAGNTALDGEAKTWLAQILYDLYTEHDWPFLIVTTTVTITGATFTLPADFLKPAEDSGPASSGFADTSLKVASVDGQAQVSPVLLRDRATFEAIDAGGVIGAPPTDWHADYTAGVGRVTPNPAGHIIVATLRYKQLPAEPANEASEKTDKPVFPWHFYLVRRVFIEALRWDSDERLTTEEAKGEAELSRIRGIARPRGTTPPTIPLDPGVFRRPFSGDC